MTIFHLIRHGENDLLRHAIAGRSPGVRLNEAGREQAERIAAYFSATPPRHLFSSPLERAMETAEPLARKTGLKINVSDAVLEVDFGDWTRKSIEELDQLETWRQWNSFRAGGQIPNGETMIAVQRRMVGELERLRRAYPDSTVAIFSHGDPIRAAVVYYLGMPLDFILRLQANPGSISTLAINDWGAQLRGFNLVP